MAVHREPPVATGVPLSKGGGGRCPCMRVVHGSMHGVPVVSMHVRVLLPVGAQCGKHEGAQHDAPI